MTVSKQSVIEELKDTDDDNEFDYHGKHSSINALKEGETHVEIKHFVVAKKERRKGIGSTVFEALLSVLQDNNIHSATVEIQALGDGSKNDPIMDFLEQYNFQYVKSFNHYNWGLCVVARGNI
jgi:GNAT superfamily N-acetyltransferase